MTCSSSRKGKIEHHDHEGERCKDGDERNCAGGYVPLDSLKSRVPANGRKPVQGDAAGRAQISVRYMHLKDSMRYMQFFALIPPLYRAITAQGHGESACAHGDAKTFRNEDQLWLEYSRVAGLGVAHDL